MIPRNSHEQTHLIWEGWESWQSLKPDPSSVSKLELQQRRAGKLIEVSQLAGALILPPTPRHPRIILPQGGHLMTSWTERHFKVRMTEVRLVLLISGTVCSGMHCSQNSLLNSPKLFPADVRPARPARCLASLLSPKKIQKYPKFNPFIPLGSTQRCTGISLFVGGRSIPAKLCKK